jgi:hypothetical protein
MRNDRSIPMDMDQAVCEGHRLLELSRETCFPGGLIPIMVLVAKLPLVKGEWGTLGINIHDVVPGNDVAARLLDTMAERLRESGG